MTEADYEQRIKKLDWFGLNQLWADIKQKKTRFSDKSRELKQMQLKFAGAYS